MDSSFCWTLYEARNFMLWGDVIELVMRLLPIAVFLIIGLRAFKHYRSETTTVGYYVTWRSLRWIVILLIPWAVTEIISSVFYVFCYSS